MKKVLAIVVDAAEPSLIEKWIASGDLPNLKQLRERAAYGKVVSDEYWPAESLPFAFYTGQNPGTHGVHGSVLWDPEMMKFRAPEAAWLPLRAFWRNFKEGDPRAIVIDAPNCYAPEPFNGIELAGWATHDLLAPYSSYPPEIADWVHQHYGSNMMPDEMYSTFRKQEFIRTRDRTLMITDKFAGLCKDFINGEPWNLFLAALDSVHHAGHRLWDTININEPLLGAEKTEFSEALRQVYMASDRAIGEIIKQVDSDTIIIVMSLHGMGFNHSRNWVLPDLLRLILGKDKPEMLSLSILKRLRNTIPVQWRHEVKSRLPYTIRRWLTRFWRSGYDWSKTKVFPLMADTQGWLRINLKGREAKGIVETDEYDALCETVSRGLKTFRDADTGEPIIHAIVKSSQIFEGDKQYLLPDLIIQWANSPASQHRAITSPEFGTFLWPTPGQNPEGRSGNHLLEGVFMMAGPDIKPDRISNIHILDLAPTILTLLGHPVPKEMEGKALSIVKS